MQRIESTHAGRAVAELRRRIIAGDLTGGVRLTEVGLAEQLQISRTPVRQALSHLAEEGLLERAAGGGYVVRAFSPGDVADAIELRGTLEGLAARLAAERGADPDGMARLVALRDQLDGCFSPDLAVDFESYRALNAAFHDCLAQLSGSAILQRELERVKSLPFASPSAFVPGRRDAVGFERSLVVAQSQHHALVEAIAAREGGRAEATAREHARIARANLDLALAAPQDPLPGRALITAPGGLHIRV